MLARLRNKSRIIIENFFENSSIVIEGGRVFFFGFAGAIALFFSNLFLSAHFGPTAFGDYKAVISLFFFLPFILDLGINFTIAKFLAEYKEKNELEKATVMLKHLLMYKAALFAVTALAIFFLRDSFAQAFLKDASKSSLIIPGIALMSAGFFESFKYVALGRQNFKKYNQANFSTLFITGALSITLGYFFGIFAALAAWGAGYFLGNLIVVFYAFKKYNFFKQTKPEFKARAIFSSYSIRVFISSLPTVATNGFVAFFSPFFPSASIGYYGFAFTFYAGITLIQNSLFNVILPKVSQLVAQGKKEAARKAAISACIAYLAIAAIGIAGTILFADTVIGLIAKAYAPGARLFKILISSGMLLGVAGVYSAYYAATSQSKKLIILTSIQTIGLAIASYFALKSI